MAYSEITEDIEKVDAARGGVLSMEAGEDVIAGQVVKAGGDNTVQPTDTDGENVIGVATQNVSAGDAVTVLSNSTVARVRAGASVSANDPVTAHGATGEEGEVATADATGDFILGVATESIGNGNVGQIIVDLGGEVN